MKMKKIGALVLALVMALSLTVTAFAADTITAVTGSENKATHGVYGEVDTTGTVQTVYSVDVTWGTMEFTYKINGESNTWDPETHDYTTTTGTSHWEIATDQDKFTVTNHSNAKVGVAVSSTAVSGNTHNVTATLKDADGTGNWADTTLESAEGTAYANAPSVAGRVAMSGALPRTLTEKTQLFTLTVTLSAVA